MGKYTEVYLGCMNKDKSLTVLEECIHSMNISIKYSHASDREKENMLSILDLMLIHHNKIMTSMDMEAFSSK